MTTKNFFEQWMKPEFARAIPGVPNLSFDVKAILEAQRKTFQALTEAQQLTVESFQTIAQRNAEILSQMVQDQSEMAREIAGSVPGESAYVFARNEFPDTGAVRGLIPGSSVQCTEVDFALLCVPHP